jgi:site-specific recombinase XerD
METNELTRIASDCLGQISNTNTLRSYRAGIDAFLKFMLNRPLNNELLLRYRAYLINNEMSNSTRNSRLASVNLLTQYLNDTRQLTLMKLNAIKFHRKLVNKTVSYELLSQMESDIINRVCYSIDDKYFRLRDLLIYWLIRQGLRRSELSTLTLDDLILTNEGYNLVVRGKGNEKQRVIVATPSLAKILSQIIDFEVSHNKFDLSPKRGLILNQQYMPITHDGIYHIFKQIFASDLSPHVIRRVVCTHLLNEGVDVLIICKWFGWSNVTTANHYDLRANEGLKSLASMIE